MQWQLVISGSRRGGNDRPAGASLGWTARSRGIV